MKPLPPSYNSKVTEQVWQKRWESMGIYHWDLSIRREDSYIIDTPPPTVSGLLHMGHIFSYTQADFIARYQRMSGKNVFYPMGFDDNGLPTERLVEKVKKIRAGDMSREAFIATCEEVVKEAEEEFRRLFKSVALSVDWTQEYQTVSPQSRKLSQLSFLDLYHKGYAYRQLQPMLWDPVDQTAIAQAEVEDHEKASHMHDIQFSDEQGKPLVIATTRPELIAACVALLYHPDDGRYASLKGTCAISPLFGVKIPVLADEKVDKEKGTGLVMCCTFGDETDIHWWRTHRLPIRLVLNKYGKIGHLEGIGKTHPLTHEPWPSIKTEALLAPVVTALMGLKAAVAREKILELLKAEGLLLKSVAITHAVKCAERSGAPLEILPTHQWFIRILDQKEALKEKSRQCEWHPDFMRIRMEQWIDGLNWDWCISRQRFFGVPFPLWYSKRPGEEGKILVATPGQLPVDPLKDLPKGYGKEEVEPEMDVMDTWATSSVSPQLSSHGISGSYTLDAERHKKLFPADLRPQAHEIIRTWAFYTLVKAHLHENTIPWKHLMISGWCLAADKSKMSKSKGNVITPVDLIEEKGADAVRFWASTSRLGTDTAFSEDVLKIGKKLVTKLWNATRFASTHLSKLSSIPTTPKKDIADGIITEILDLWILSRLQYTIKKATEEFEQYEYCNARAATEDFFWNDFCDNYLELVKARAYGEIATVTPHSQQSAITTLYHCLDAILRLFAPFVPHITEELYTHIFDDKIASGSGSVHGRGMWPGYGHYPYDEEALTAGGYCLSLLNAVRKIKAEHNVSLKTPLIQFIIEMDAGIDSKTYVKPYLFDLQQVTNALNITFGAIPQDIALKATTEDKLFTIGTELGKEMNHH